MCTSAIIAYVHLSISVNVSCNMYSIASLFTCTFDPMLQTMLMLRDVATRHRPVAIVTDLRSSSQLREMVRPTKEELSKVSPLPFRSFPSYLSLK